MPTQPLRAIGKARKVVVSREQGKHIGFVAQEIEKEFPEVVVTGHDGHKGIAYDKMAVVLLGALKEQQAVIAALGNKVESLELEFRRRE